MNNFTKPVAAIALAGALALAMATPSEARSGRNAAAIGAGVAGFAVGAAVGAAAASNNYYGPAYGYHEPSYGYYEPAYGYTYAPAYRAPVYEGYAYAPGPTRYYQGDPSAYYAPGGSYGPRTHGGWQNRERALRGGDW